MTWEQEKQDGLYAMFSINEHEVREGATSKSGDKIQWFVYVRREAIQKRLDHLFFGEWSLGFLDSQSPYQYHKDHVDCAMYLEIRGLRREYNGSQQGTGLNGAKGAATDALKRVASLWGLGLYLQNSPSIWTENYKVKKNGQWQIDWNKKNRMEAEAMRRVGQWLKNLGANGDVPELPDDTTTGTATGDQFSAAVQEQQRQQAGDPPPNVTQGDFNKPPQGEAGKEYYGKPTKRVYSKRDRKDNPYMTISGATLYSREAFRKLGYDDDVIEALGNIGHTDLPDPVTIAYVMDNEFKNVVRIRRDSTGDVVDAKGQPVDAKAS